MNESFQSAYRKLHSPESALLMVCNYVRVALGRREGTMLLLLDLNSAFETIDHNVPLNRICKHRGLHGCTLRCETSRLRSPVRDFKAALFGVRLHGCALRCETSWLRSPVRDFMAALSGARLHGCALRCETSWLHSPVRDFMAALSGARPQTTCCDWSDYI